MKNTVAAATALLVGSVVMLPCSAQADTTTPPTIATGGPYFDTLGAALDINATIESDEGDGSYPLQYGFRINGGTAISGTIPLGDSPTVDPVISWSSLVSDGISTTSDGTYSIQFVARDNYFNVATVTTTLTEAAPVPLPASAWLMLSSLGTFAVLARRRKTAAA
jgi:hypothetical protein